VIGGPLFAFKGREPVVFRIVFLAAVTLFATMWAIGITSPWWAPQTSGPSHPVGVQFKGHVTYFYPAPVSWLLKYGLWVFFGLLGVLALIMWRHRAEVHRVR
jgi:glycerol-3-phosphate acyltransferase PlsY